MSICLYTCMFGINFVSFKLGSAKFCRMAEYHQEQVPN